jgi:hypothetical protein
VHDLEQVLGRADVYLPVLQQVVVGDPVHGQRAAPVQDLGQVAAPTAQVLHDDQGCVEVVRPCPEQLVQR